MKCGLLGEKLGYSYSKAIHNLLASYEYELYPTPHEQLAQFLTTTECSGLNVTIPYKQAVMDFCKFVDEKAAKMQAVNTLVRRKDGFYGYNTDHYGFSYLAKRGGVSFEGRNVLILGNGATSRTVECVAYDEGAKSVLHVSRSGPIDYENAYAHQETEIIVNATPVGTYPNTGAKVIDISRFKNLMGVLDVVYNPARTALLLEAERMGLPHEGGLSMLVAQAKRAAELFTETSIPEEKTEEVIAKLFADTLNIVLIGMPGSGKSSVGKRIAELTNRPFVDTDALIAEEAGMSIHEIFALEGEAGFRAREQAVIEKIGRERSQVIATGGGAPLREANRDALRQNGFVAELCRDLSLLPTDGRPLSKDPETLKKMYIERAPIYKQARQLQVVNDSTIEHAAKAVLEGFHEECTGHKRA